MADPVTCGGGGKRLLTCGFISRSFRSLPLDFRCHAGYSRDHWGCRGRTTTFLSVRGDATPRTPPRPPSSPGSHRIAGQAGAGARRGDVAPGFAFGCRSRRRRGGGKHQCDAGDEQPSTGVGSDLSGHPAPGRTREEILRPHSNGPSAYPVDSAAGAPVPRPGSRFAATVQRLRCIWTLTPTPR